MSFKKILNSAKDAIKISGLAFALLISPSFSAKSSAAEYVSRPIDGMCYGPFREGQSPELGIYPTTNQIVSDISLAKNVTKKIRTYGNENNLFYIPKLCNNIDLDCYPAAWINNVAEDANQVSRLITIGNSNLVAVKGAIVGTEFLYRNPSQFAKHTNYLKQVRQGITNQSIKVTACEQWHIWRDYPALADSVDFIMINIHPYWENQNISNAANFVLDRYNYIKGLFPGRQVMIGETGWPSAGAVRGEAVPSIENQRRFIEDFTRISFENEIKGFFFEFTDEPWKEKYGLVEGSWGAFDKNRKLKKGLEQKIREDTVITSLDNERLLIRTYDGDNYSIQQTGSLMPTNWIGITNFTGTLGTNTSLISIPINTNKASFYRVVLNLN